MAQRRSYVLDSQRPAVSEPGSRPTFLVMDIAFRPLCLRSQGSRCSHANTQKCEQLGKHRWRRDAFPVQQLGVAVFEMRQSFKAVLSGITQSKPVPNRRIQM